MRLVAFARAPAVMTAFSHLAEADRDLVIRFIEAFSRAEYTLKRGGYLKATGDSVSADWDVFARTIRGKFGQTRSREFGRALQMLLQHPPRKQALVDGLLGWKDGRRPAGASDEEHALLLVRRTRNNLFHGEKFVLGGMGALARDRDLVAAALEVLAYALSGFVPRSRTAEARPPAVRRKPGQR